MRFILRVSWLIAGLLVLVSAGLLYSLRRNASGAYWMLEVGTNRDAFRAGLYRMLPDGSGRHVVSRDNMLAMIRTVRWSPDGRWIFYLQPVQGDRYELWRVNVAGSRRDQVANDVYWTRFRDSFQFAPDGRWLVFPGEKEGGQRLYRLEVDTAETQAVALTEAQAIVSYAWSVDSRWIYYSVETAGAPRLYRVRMEGGEAEVVAEAAYLLPVWSPDGEWVVFSNGMATGDSYRLRVADGHFDTIRSGCESCYPLAWLANNWLLAVKNPGMPFAAVYRMRPDGSEAVPVLGDVVPTAVYGRPATGEWVIVQGGAGDSLQLYRVNLDTLEARVLVEVAGFRPLPGAWTGGKETVLVAGRQEGAILLYRVGVEDGAATLLLRLRPGEIDPQMALTPDERAVVVSTLEAATFERVRRRIDLATGDVLALPGGDLPVFSPLFDIEPDWRAGWLVAVGSGLLVGGGWRRAIKLIIDIKK